MRGLLKAGLLLAPALASAFVVPEKWTDEKVEEVVVHNGHSGHRKSSKFITKAIPLFTISVSSACVDVHVPVNPQSESSDFRSNDSIVSNQLSHICIVLM